MEQLLDWLKAELTMKKIPAPMIDLAVNLVGGIAGGIRDLVESQIEANRATALAGYAAAAHGFSDMDFAAGIVADCVESAREIAGLEEKEGDAVEDPPASA